MCWIAGQNTESPQRWRALRYLESTEILQVGGTGCTASGESRGCSMGKTEALKGAWERGVRFQ